MNEKKKTKEKSRQESGKTKKSQAVAHRRILTAEGWKRRVASYFYYKHQDDEDHQ
jgi:hypothetical protein